MKNNNETVFDMIEKYLKNNEMDGLYNNDYECACDINDLAPCYEIKLNCVAGYKHNHPNDKSFFIIKSDNKVMTKEDWLEFEHLR